MGKLAHPAGTATSESANCCVAKQSVSALNYAITNVGTLLIEAHVTWVACALCEDAAVSGMCRRDVGARSNHEGDLPHDPTSDADPLAIGRYRFHRSNRKKLYL